jgi:hypothetical protein
MLLSKTLTLCSAVHIYSVTTAHRTAIASSCQLCRRLGGPIGFAKPRVSGTLDHNVTPPRWNDSTGHQHKHLKRRPLKSHCACLRGAVLKGQWASSLPSDWPHLLLVRDTTAAQSISHTAALLAKFTRLRSRNCSASRLRWQRPAARRRSNLRSTNCKLCSY